MVDKQIYVIYNTDTRFVSKIYVSDYDKAVLIRLRSRLSTPWLSTLPSRSLVCS